MDRRQKLLMYDERAFTVPVDTGEFGPETKELFDFINGRVIGQERAANRLARAFSVYNAGLADPALPIGSYLFAGPTGVGKTMMAGELAKFLIGKDLIRPPMTRIPCGKLREGHRVSELLGSPPGYVGYDKPSKLLQLKIDEAHFWEKVRPFIEKRFKNVDPKKVQQAMLKLYEQFQPYYSVILFDEVEKAHPDLWNLLLHIIDDGELDLADGSVTSFANSVIILTCNVGGRRQQDLLSGKKSGIGFGRATALTDPETTDQVIYEETVKLIEKHFPPELVGRLRNEIIVFRTLDRDSTDKVLDLMLREVQKLVSGDEKSRSIPLLLFFSRSFRDHLLDKGTDRTYGLRPLRKTVQKLVKLRLANAIEAGDLLEGDEVLFTMKDARPLMLRKPRPEATRVSKPPSVPPPPALPPASERPSSSGTADGSKNGDDQ